jgi:hypothetical protein
MKLVGDLVEMGKIAFVQGIQAQVKYGVINERLPPLETGDSITMENTINNLVLLNRG